MGVTLYDVTEPPPSLTLRMYCCLLGSSYLREYTESSMTSKTPPSLTLRIYCCLLGCSYLREYTESSMTSQTPRSLTLRMYCCLLGSSYLREYTESSAFQSAGSSSLGSVLKHLKYYVQKVAGIQPKITINVPLFKKLQDIIFFCGTITFLAISRDILRGSKKSRPPQNVPRNG